MFEYMEFLEYISEVVVETSCKKPTRAYDNHDGHSRKIRGEYASSNTYFEISESGGKRRKKYVDHPKDSSKPICLIRGPVHSSYEFKVMWDYCSKCTKVRPTKDRGHNPTKKKKFNRQEYNNDIVNHAVDEILLQ